MEEALGLFGKKIASWGTKILKEEHVLGKAASFSVGKRPTKECKNPLQTRHEIGWTDWKGSVTAVVKNTIATTENMSLKIYIGKQYF